MDQAGSEQRLNLPEAGGTIYFIGICGISMSGLAEMSQALGFRVVGSDKYLNARYKHLKTLGIDVYEGHSADSIDKCQPDLVVYTLAIPADNPERMRAVELGIPCVERAAFLGLLNRMFQRVINISGTNGKTTTTAMTALMLIASGQDPTVHLGAELKQFKTTVHMGEPGKLLVSEACEFGRGFLHYHSTTATVLNIDHDHVNCFPSLDDVIDAFSAFAQTLEPGAKLILPMFDPNIPVMLQRVLAARPTYLREIQLIWFGSADDAIPSMGQVDETMAQAVTYTYRNLEYVDGKPHFDLCRQGDVLCSVALRLPGQYNVENAMAAIACTLENGGDPQVCADVLADFQGAEGRFTITGECNGATIIADYAHHPASVTAAIEAAKTLPHKNIWVVFQPITHSRAKGLAKGFVDALKPYDRVYLAEIFDDRETDVTFSSGDIVRAIREQGGSATFAADQNELEKELAASVEPGDIVWIMGQDVRQIADRLTGRTDHFA